MMIMFQVYREEEVSSEKQRKGWWPSKQLKILIDYNFRKKNL